MTVGVDICRFISEMHIISIFNKYHQMHTNKLPHSVMMLHFEDILHVTPYFKRYIYTHSKMAIEESHCIPGDFETVSTAPLSQVCC